MFSPVSSSVSLPVSPSASSLNPLSVFLTVPLTVYKPDGGHIKPWCATCLRPLSLATSLQKCTFLSGQMWTSQGRQITRMTAATTDLTIKQVSQFQIWPHVSFTTYGAQRRAFHPFRCAMDGSSSGSGRIC